MLSLTSAEMFFSNALAPFANRLRVIQVMAPRISDDGQFADWVLVESEFFADIRDLFQSLKRMTITGVSLWDAKLWRTPRKVNSIKSLCD
jgi:hypothetical protein